MGLISHIFGLFWAGKYKKWWQSPYYEEYDQLFFTKKQFEKKLSSEFFKSIFLNVCVILQTLEPYCKNQIQNSQKYYTVLSVIKAHHFKAPVSAFQIKQLAILE